MPANAFYHARKAVFIFGSRTSILHLRRTSFPSILKHI